MIVRCWGEVNGYHIDFSPLKDRPGYWTGVAPRVEGLQQLKIWAENDKGARGQIELGVYVYPYRETQVRLLLSPFKVVSQRTYDISPLQQWKTEDDSMLDQCMFRVGETKNVQINIENTLNPDDVFEVTEASFELKHGDSVESSGECQVDRLTDNSVTVSALVTPMINKTIYRLVYSYNIGPEHFIHEVKVRVI